jgi:hypothetical protein
LATAAESRRIIQGRISANQSLRFLYLVDEGKIGHDHAKCFGVIDSSENLSSDSIEFVDNLVGQRNYERGVDCPSWNVQPLVPIKIMKSCLSGLGFEIHDEVLGEGVPSSYLEQGKELLEIVLGKPGIDCEPNLNPFPYGGDNSGLQPILGCILSGHTDVSLCCSVRQICNICKSSGNERKFMVVETTIVLGFGENLGYS